MEEILGRLRQLRAYTGLKQTEFSQRIGMAGNSYSQIETGVNPLKDRHIALICLTFGVNEAWLRTGEGEMFNEKPQSPPEQPIFDLNGQELTHEEIIFISAYRKLEESGKEVASKMVDALLKTQDKPTKSEPPLLTSDPEPAYMPEIKVYRPPELDNNVEFLGDSVVYLPFYGETAAGKPISFDATPGEVVPWAKAMIRGEVGRYFVLRVRGGSMAEADIQDGDLVLMRRAEAPRQNRIMLIRHENESTLKRIKMKGDQEVYMCWEDGSGQTVRLDDQDYEIQGEFVGIMRG